MKDLEGVGVDKAISEEDTADMTRMTEITANGGNVPLNGHPPIRIHPKMTDLNCRLRGRKDPMKGHPINGHPPIRIHPKMTDLSCHRRGRQDRMKFRSDKDSWRMWMGDTEILTRYVAETL